MGGARQKRQAEKAFRDRWGFRLTFWGAPLALAAFGYTAADHHINIASALYLGMVAVLIAGMWFARWATWEKVFLSVLLLSGYGYLEWKWYSDVAAEEAARVEAARLEAEKATAMVAPTITGWGAHDTGCVANINTSRLIQYRNTHNFYMACQVLDPTVDLLQNTSIAISNPFHIASAQFQIVINYDPKSSVAKLSRNAVNTGAMAQESTFILPKDVEVSNIKKLADVPKMGGTLWPMNDEQSMILPNP